LGYHSAPNLPEEYQGRYFQALGQFVSNLSLKFPLLVLVEDLHWMDRSSLPVWKHWCEVLPQSSSLCLATSRTFEAGQGAQLHVPLTRLNPTESARDEWQRSHRLGHSLCLAIFDIDHFKKFNDNSGHSVGDAVLATVSSRCRDSLRTIDHLGRLGGEELLAPSRR
jgi:hypothetical protein